MATILKNNIKPGGSTLKGLVATDASGNQRDVKFVRQVNSQGAATTVYDTFDHYEYSEITITANHTYNGDVGANGSAVAVASAPQYKQTRWSVGASGAKYEETTLTSGATVTYSGTHVATNGTVSGDSLGTNAVARNTAFASSVATVSMNGKSASTSGVSVAQAANAKTGTANYNGFTQNCYQSYTEYQVTGFASVGDIPAYGGSSYAQGTGQSRTNYKGSSYTKYEIHDVYTSGGHKHNGSYTTASGWTDGNTPSAGAWGGNTTVKGSTVSGTSLGTTTTSSRTNKGNSTTTWNGVACSAAIYQAINAKSSTAATALNGRTQACYKAITEYQIVNFAALGDVPASGGKQKGQGTGQSRTNYSTSSYTKYDYYFTWTAYAGDSNAKQFSYTSTASGWTDGSAPSAGAWGGNTTVTGSEVSGSNLTTNVKSRTNLGNSSVTWNGKSASCAIYQAANALGTQHYKNTSGTTGDNWAYGTPSNPTLTNNLKANGGSVTCSGSSVTNTKTYYLMYTSGSYSGLQTEKPAGSVGYTISSNGNSRFAFASGSGTVINHSNMTTNATTDTLGVKAYNASDSSKQSAQVTASVTNSYSDAWNNPSISAYSYTSSSFAYGGGTSSSPTVTATQSGTRTFTTGSTSSISNSSFSKSYSMSATGFSVNSSTGVVTAGTNTGAARSGTVTVTVTGSGSKSATKTYTFSQAVNPTNGYAYVDLGLPSGLKWAKCNIGATNEGDVGSCFEYGSVIANTYGKYDISRKNDLTDSQDAAVAIMKGNWHMPTSAQVQELKSYTVVKNTFYSTYKVEVASNENSNSLVFAGGSYTSSVSKGIPTYRTRTQGICFSLQIFGYANYIKFEDSMREDVGYPIKAVIML